MRNQHWRSGQRVVMRLKSDRRHKDARRKRADAGQMTEAAGVANMAAIGIAVMYGRIRLFMHTAMLAMHHRLIMLLRLLRRTVHTKGHSNRCHRL